MGVETEPGLDTPRPSSQILSLVSAFLSEHGLEATSKALRKELKRLDLTTDLESVQDGVNLQNIVESWNKQEAVQSTSDEATSAESDATTSDSDSGSSSATSSEADEKTSSSEDTSAAESESESESEEAKAKPSKLKRIKVNKREASPSASTSSSSSDSDADDEGEDEGDVGPKVRTARKKSPTITKQPEPARSLKRKADSSSPEPSSSDSNSSDDDRPAKRAKVAMDSEVSSSEAASSESEQETSDAETSSSEEEQEDDGKKSLARPKSLATLMSATAETPSDSSSNTVMGDVVEPGRNIFESEESAEKGPHPTINKSKKQTATEKNHVGAKATPLAQLSTQATADSHISNAYKSYDYADRAYNDLSVTRGKGFTKEKNKKKRGSYRGGAIDINGGKGFKFED